ncbi:MAG: hypothetical protein GIW99_00290, partial [Candidatus Eremiobacteraeota bacterium]|nr:hypothetical protein [Candidatus Eremiobacteraeota bacterium]
FTRSPIYHVALAEAGYEVIEARPRGVARRDVSKPPVRLDFIVLPAPEGAGAAALAWAATKIGDGYDKMDIAVIALDRIFKHFHLNYIVGDRFTCGEFVATAFEHAGVKLFPDIPAADVEPSDFAGLLPAQVRAGFERRTRMKKPPPR